MAFLRDGLGGEEVTESGLTYSGIAPLNPYWIGSITTESDMKGANIYGDTTVSGATIKGTIISGGSAKITTISGTDIFNVNGELESSICGSPSVFGAIVQAGSSILSSNVKWVVFGTAFTGSPVVTISDMTFVGSAALPSIIGPVIGSIGCGSFCASGAGAGASDAFTWIAVGNI